MTTQEAQNKINTQEVQEFMQRVMQFGLARNFDFVNMTPETLGGLIKNYLEVDLDTNKRIKALPFPVIKQILKIA